VNASDLESPGRVNHLELVNLQGDSITDLPITTDRSPQAGRLYNSSAFFPPAEFFYIKVTSTFIIIIIVIDISVIIVFVWRITKQPLVAVFCPVLSICAYSSALLQQQISNVAPHDMTSLMDSSFIAWRCGRLRHRR